MADKSKTKRDEVRSREQDMSRAMVREVVFCGE